MFGKIAAFLPLITLLGLGTPSIVRGCGLFTPQVNFSITPEGWLQANGVTVTMTEFYSWEDTKANLGIEDSTFAQWRRDKRSVLSIGEGVGILLPTLLENRVDARGVDIWYDQTASLPNHPVSQQMRDYVTRYRTHLDSGNAFHLPYSDGKFDIVLAHRLLNNFPDLKSVAAILHEMIRVVAIGGEIRAGKNREIANPQTFCSSIESHYPEGSIKVRFNPESRIITIQKLDSTEE